VVGASDFALARGSSCEDAMGASGDEIASIGRLLTERWLHRRRCKLANGAIDAQAEETEKNRSTT
jgi:hypothetical protein